MLRFLVLLPILVACGTKSADPEQGSATAGPATAPPAAPKEYSFTQSEAKVKVKLVPPPGWKEEVGESSVDFQGSWMSRLSVGITCHGSCDTVEQAKRNIAKQAQELFDFVKGPNHIPQLEPTWIRKVTEDPPGTWSWRFHAVNRAEKQEELSFSFDRILPGGDPTSTRILTCNAKLEERDAKSVDALEKLCRELVFEVAKQPGAKP